MFFSSTNFTAVVYLSFDVLDISGSVEFTLQYIVSFEVLTLVTSLDIIEFDQSLYSHFKIVMIAARVNIVLSFFFYFFFFFFLFLFVIYF
jgi:hypothetical protein